MLIDSLVEHALEKAAEKTVRDVRAGLAYTCVVLDDSSCGLAYTFRDELGECCGILDEAGSLIGRRAADIIPWAKSPDRLKAAIGLAAINAVLNVPKAGWEAGNVVDALDLRPADTFGMVGEFRPILSEIRKRTKNIYVFERHAAKDGETYPSEAIPLHLPKCDLVVITATSVINHTIDGILECCKRAREVVIVGPSTPLCPEVFGRYGATMLAGSVVEDPETILRIVSQAGGTTSMKPALRQVLAPCRRFA